MATRDASDFFYLRTLIRVVYFNFKAMNWELCLICQAEDKPEPLKCPLDSLQDGAGKEAYLSFLKNVVEFSNLGALPVELKLKEDTSIEELCTNRAVWHKSCHLKFANSKLERAQKKLKRKNSPDSSRQAKKVKRQVSEQSECFFCGEQGNDLHQVLTLEVDRDVRQMAVQMQDSQLIAKLAAGDMVAIEAKYHSKCMLAFKRKYTAYVRSFSGTETITNDSATEARTFAELISFMEGSAESGTLLFKLSSLHELYVSRLRSLRVDKSVNKTRLKNRIIEHYHGEIQEQSDGKNTVLVFNQGIEELLKDALKKRNCEEEAFNLVNVAKCIRNDVFQTTAFHFTGEFNSECQSKSVPPSLMCLVSMLLNGPNIDSQESEESQACLTIAQLILFNMKKIKKPTTKENRHCQDREPPLPLYLGMSLHAQTRSKKIVNQLYQLGLSVSYHRVDEIMNSLATSVCDHFKSVGVVCPLALQRGLFTVGAIDNIDHNPSSTTAQGSFHGTGISLFQFPKQDSEVSQQAVQGVSLCATKTTSRDITLPDEYSSVPPVSIKTSEVNVPPTGRAGVETPGSNQLTTAIAQETCWLKHCEQHLHEELTKGTYLSWAAYHASVTVVSNPLPCLGSLLPLFDEKAATVAMMKHGMLVMQKATELLNPGQIPVTVCDQPLFAIAKFVQWNWPSTHGENLHVVMLGGLHIEMALWSLCGDLLAASGWTAALTEAGIASTGTSDSFLRVAHLTKTRRAHQITAVALHKLQQIAFAKLNGQHDDEEFQKWHDGMIKNSPTYKFWFMIMQMELTVLVFVKAHRENNFSLYVEALESLAPWFFALDHTNYARWLPIHIRDMKCLPGVVQDDLKKCWVISKSSNKFSSIPIDQAHEQNNASVKGSGGAVGLTESPVAFRRWMVAGPETARLLEEFESQLKGDPGVEEKNEHHEQGLSTQKAFQSHVKNLVNTISEMGNPFQDDCPELLALDTRNCADASVVATVHTVQEIGLRQYEKYVKEVIKERTVSIHDTISKNSLPLFKRQQPKQISKASLKLTAVASDRYLFSRLYIASQQRDGDLEEFFKHENQPYPPSLSEFGNLRFGKKSDLITCVNRESPPAPASFDVKVFDGAAIVHALPVSSVSTFLQYADSTFLPFLENHLKSTKRIDVVWDEYRSASLKEATREKRGKGVRRKVAGHVKLPQNWQAFLEDSSNKKELFTFLTKQVETASFPADKFVYITSGNKPT